MIWWHIKDCSLDPHFRCICKDCWIEAAGDQTAAATGPCASNGSDQPGDQPECESVTIPSGPGVTHHVLVLKGMLPDIDTIQRHCERIDDR
jgi:hypothetical protein